MTGKRRIYLYCYYNDQKATGDKAVLEVLYNNRDTGKSDIAQIFSLLYIISLISLIHQIVYDIIKMCQIRSLGRPLKAHRLLIHHQLLM